MPRLTVPANPGMLLRRQRSPPENHPEHFRPLNPGPRYQLDDAGVDSRGTHNRHHVVVQAMALVGRAPMPDWPGPATATIIFDFGTRCSMSVFSLFSLPSSLPSFPLCRSFLCPEYVITVPICKQASKQERKKERKLAKPVSNIDHHRCSP